MSAFVRRQPWLSRVRCERLYRSITILRYINI